MIKMGSMQAVLRRPNRTVDNEKIGNCESGQNG